MKAVLFFLIFVPIEVFAQTTTNSLGSAIFTNASIWSSPKDLTGTANIQNGHTVTIPLDNTVYADKLTFSGSGKLSLAGSTSKWVPSTNSINATPLTTSFNFQANWLASTVWTSEAFNAAHYTPWIDSSQGWSAGSANNKTDYLQYDLLSNNWIQGIVTQGRANGAQWVTSAKIQVSVDGTNWLTAFEDTSLNTDSNTKVSKNFPRVMYGRYVRVTPINVNGHATMRMGILLRDYPLKSCNEILTKFPGATSGVYSIDPDGTLGASPTTSCYCDMTTDGGGWTLVLNYLHLAARNSTLTYKTQSLPLLGSTTLGVDESGSTTTWGHVTPAYLSTFSFSELRFYGKTSGHTRVIHFKTSHSGTINYFKTGTSTYSMSGVQTAGNFTSLSGHNANIPDRASSFYNFIESQNVNNAMTFFPFFIGGLNHWGIGANNRWEVDDMPGDSRNNTYHQIWIR